MEKQGIIHPKVTPDTENKLTDGVKQADTASQINSLDDDVTKRLAEKTKDSLKVD